MNRRKFLASAACMLSLLGIRKEAGKSELRKIRSLKDEWWCSADYIETDRDGTVTTKVIYWKLTA